MNMLPQCMQSAITVIILAKKNTIKKKFRFSLHPVPKSENNSWIQQLFLPANHYKPYSFKVKFKRSINMFEYTNEQLGKTNNTNAALLWQFWL